MSEEAWLRLAFAGLHPARIAALLGAEGAPDRVVAVLERDGREVPGAAAAAARLRAWGGRFEVDGSWSGRFTHVADAPSWLFIEGDIDAHRLVGIVGTRRCTAYGRRVAHELAAAAAAAGWGVVSGLARGIDQAAHRGALQGGGPTIAVLGAGPDVDYPRRTGPLRAEMVASGGAVVSEYAPGMEPLPWRFPARNRIISGLSEAVIVVESGASGGSLSTAARAVAQARTVFAVPGDIDRVASIGCNLLIRDGAVPVLGPDDLVEALAVLPGR